jgi:hypothetical protein
MHRGGNVPPVAGGALGLAPRADRQREHRSSRLLRLPLYLGLIVAQGAYVSPLSSPHCPEQKAHTEIRPFSVIPEHSQHP